MNLLTRLYRLLEEHGPMFAGELKLRDPYLATLYDGDIARAMRKGADLGYIQIERIKHTVHRYAITNKPFLYRSYYRRACILHAHDGMAWVFPNCRIAGQFVGMTGPAIQHILNYGRKCRGEAIYEIGTC